MQVGNFTPKNIQVKQQHHWLTNLFIPMIFILLTSFSTIWVYLTVAEKMQEELNLRLSFGVLFFLLLILTVVVMVLIWVINIQKEQMRKVETEVKQLGQYTLEEKIGEGGIGVVYKASHAMLRRPTVIKFLKPECSDRVTNIRFEREVQTTSRLTHPNTITVYDYGQTPEGIFYYAMEYIEGIDLRRLVKKFGSLSEGRVVHILRQVCASLEEAHNIGFIHRDIKPENIVISSRAGLYDNVKVLDFGLVKNVEEQKQKELPKGVTKRGMVAGTPQYLSPEAIRTPQSIDHRSDIYSIGALGYYLLTGREVFLGTKFIEICVKQVKEKPTPPSEHIETPLNEDLEKLILKCLEKDPKNRPQSTRELCDDLKWCKKLKYWTKEKAKRWWENYGARLKAEQEESLTKTPSSINGETNAR